MKAFLLLAVIMFPMAEPVLAAGSDDTEYDIIAVVPRGPDVKPYFLSVPAQGRGKTAVQIANPGPDAKPSGGPSGLDQPKLLTKDVFRPARQAAQPVD